MLRRTLARFACGLLLCCACASAAHAALVTYTVGRGDTLWSIARSTGRSVAQIARLNHLADADYLRPGQVLVLSAPARSAGAAARTRTGRAIAVGRRPARLALVKPARGLSQRPAGAALRSEHQALWVATHSGVSGVDPAFGLSLGEAERALVLELRLTRTALRYIGVPYLWGGESFAGMDCSGFVQAVFRRNGIELPRTADAQFEVGRRVTTAGLLPGDLVFFQTYTEGASHVGIYLGSGRFVHASSSHGVRVDYLSESYFANRYLGARRAAI